MMRIIPHTTYKGTAPISETVEQCNEKVPTCVNIDRMKVKSLIFIKPSFHDCSIYIYILVVYGSYGIFLLYSVFLS